MFLCQSFTGPSLPVIYRASMQFEDSKMFFQIIIQWEPHYEGRHAHHVSHFFDC